jgi:hypothetical protein
VMGVLLGFVGEIFWNCYWPNESLKFDFR